MSSFKKDPLAPGAGGLVAEELVEVQPPEEVAVPTTQQERQCDRCGSKELRIGHGMQGIRAYCISCKNEWGIAATTGSRSIPTYGGRGMSKQTLVEPDWGLAYEDDVDTVGFFDEEEEYI